MLVLLLTRFVFQTKIVHLVNFASILYKNVDDLISLSASLMSIVILVIYAFMDNAFKQLVQTVKRSSVKSGLNVKIQNVSEIYVSMLYARLDNA